MNSINDLCWVASVVLNLALPAGYTLPNPVSLTFSVAEAASTARGFRRASDISNIAQADFQQALTGTVALRLTPWPIRPIPAVCLCTRKQQMVSPPTTVSSGTTSGAFQPINPDGSLVNCVPPPCLSPFSPIAYLQEMLNLSQASTCENPWSSPSPVETTLGEAVTTRRGPLGTLLASCANLETPLPMIDIVNECLEYLGATQPPSSGTALAPSGTIYDTSDDELAGYNLCNEDDCNRDNRGCHKPAEIFAALPEFSTPPTPVTPENDSVEPLVYNNLKTDFSSCCLPYSQALDVSAHLYLRHLGTCRFEELRTFQEMASPNSALDPRESACRISVFLSGAYRCALETAIEYLGITPEEYAMLYQGTPSQSCGQQYDNHLTAGSGNATGASASTVSVAELYGGYSEG